MVWVILVFRGAVTGTIFYYNEKNILIKKQINFSKHGVKILDYLSFMV